MLFNEKSNAKPNSASERELEPSSAITSRMMAAKARSRRRLSAEIPIAAAIAALTLGLGLYISAMIDRQPEIILYIDDQAVGMVESTAVVEDAFAKAQAEHYAMISLGETEAGYELPQVRCELSAVNVANSKTVYTADTDGYVTDSTAAEAELEYLDEEECVRLLLAERQKRMVSAFWLYIDGERIAPVESEDVIRSVLERINSELSAAAKMGGAVSVTISNRVDIIADAAAQGDLVDADTLYAMLLFDSADGESALGEYIAHSRTHSHSEDTSAASETEAPEEAVADAAAFAETESALGAQQGRSADGSVYENVMTLSDVESRSYTAAADIIPECYSYSSTLECQIILSETALLPYSTDTVYVADENQVEGYEHLDVEGSDGVREVTYLVTVDPATGEVLSRVESSSKPVVDAVSTVIRVGTIPILEPGVGSGRLIWPVETFGMKVTSLFREYREPFDDFYGHFGLDAIGEYGDEIIAVDGGVVTTANSVGTYGLFVVIDHGNGLESRYAHMSKMAVKVGDKVTQGQLIGYVGDTGSVTAPHLHFELKDGGELVDPLDYLPAWQSRDEIHGDVVMPQGKIIEAPTEN